MVDAPGTIAKLRQMQIGFFLAHFVLLIVGATQFAVAGGEALWLVTVLPIAMALWELFGRSSLLRASVDELQIWPISRRPLRWYERLVVAAVIALTVAQLLAVTLLDPSEMTSVIAMAPFLVTMAFLPLAIVFWAFDGSIIRTLSVALKVGFRPPPPESDEWDEIRSVKLGAQELKPVFVLFWGCFNLQLLLLTIWANSLEFLLFWAILTTGLLKEVPLTRKLKPAEDPIHDHGIANGA